MKKWFVAILMLISIPVYAETVTGVAVTQEELRQAIAEWSFQVRNQVILGKCGTYAYCINRGTNKVIWAYTAGEPTPFRAKEKALHALKIRGICEAYPVVLEEVVR